MQYCLRHVELSNEVSKENDDNDGDGDVMMMMMI